MGGDGKFSKVRRGYGEFKKPEKGGGGRKPIKGERYSLERE